jgi:hypothetical protein
MEDGIIIKQGGKEMVEEKEGIEEVKEIIKGKIGDVEAMDLGDMEIITTDKKVIITLPAGKDVYVLEKPAFPIGASTFRKLKAITD